MGKAKWVWVEVAYSSPGKPMDGPFERRLEELSKACVSQPRVEDGRRILQFYIRKPENAEAFIEAVERERPDATCRVLSEEEANPKLPKSEGKHRLADEVVSLFFRDRGKK